MIYMSTRLKCFSIVSMTDIGSISESGIVLIAFFNPGYVSCDDQCHPLIYAVQDSGTPNQHEIHICVVRTRPSGRPNATEALEPVRGSLYVTQYLFSNALSCTDIALWHSIESKNLGRPS